MSFPYETELFNGSEPLNSSFLFPLFHPGSTAVPTQVSRHPDNYGQTLRAISFALLRYVLPLIIAAGTFGNVLAIVVIVRKRMLGKSVYFYLLSLACADTAVLYVSALKTWVRAAFHVEFLHVSDVACKSLMFLLVLALHMSAWLVVFVTSDRFVAVWFPLKAAIFCTTRRAAIVTATCLVVMVIYNCQLLWTIHLQVFPERNNITQCGPYPTDHFHNHTYQYLKFATYSFIPFGIVLIFNVGIVIKLKRDSPALRNAQSGGRHESSRAASQTETQRRITYMLLTVSFSWLFLTLPFTLFTLFPARWFIHQTYGNAILQLVKVISFLLMYINHSTNFYLYCLTGKKFRQEVAEILCPSRFRKRRKTLRSSTHMTHMTRGGMMGDHSGIGYTSTCTTTNGMAMAEL